MKGPRVTVKPSIKFSEIRALEGKQDKGFEELCVQLLPLLVGEKVTRIDRVEGRGGDGGVEAIAFTVFGNFVGLQSKFFAKMDNPQWRQIDDSVKTALAKHPEVTRYIVCVPLDRTPGQIKKWDLLVATWRALNPTLCVQWNGYSELLGYLLKPAASHLLTYWFDCPDFSISWVSKQTEVAIGHLHDRYTPTLHQDTSAEVELGFRSGSKKAVDAHRKACSTLVILWRKVIEKAPREIARLKSSASLEKLQLACQTMQRDLHGGNLIEQGDDFIEALCELSKQGQQLLDNLFPSDAAGEYDRKQYREFCRDSKLDEALNQTNETLEEVKRFVDAQRQPIWVLTGEAGSGKSHLMASLARTILAEGRPCLLVVGERFASQDVMASQIPGLVDWHWSMRELLACLSIQAANTGSGAVLMIDAINESPARGLWRRELQQLVALVQEFPEVKLLVSCRSDCLESSIPETILSQTDLIRHRGFDLQFHAAVKAYFDGYKVISPQFPTLNAEFRNPLFLKTLCEAYRNRTLPLGPVSFVRVLIDWEARIAETIEARIDCPRGATTRAVNEIVEALAQSEARRMEAAKVESICLRHFSVPTASNSLYRHLNSAGLLQEIETPDGLKVRLQYERFSDVRIAQVALQGFSTKGEWLAYWQSKMLPSLVKAGRLDSVAAARVFAYALLLPDALGLELVECPIATLIHEDWARSRAKDVMWSSWLDALPWRVLDPKDSRILRLFNLWAKTARSQRHVWERILQFACVPGHPLNADRLHGCLFSLALPAREVRWTTSLALESATDQTGESVVAPFLYWADAAAGLASEEQVRLASIVVLWLTSSPNRELRDRATDIAIRLLVASRSGSTCMRLLEGFWEVNDPYVKERLLAVMCGVLPHLCSLGSQQVAEFVLFRFWRQGEVAPHILQRDYAEFIVRHACEAGTLPASSLVFLEKKVSRSKPKVWTEEQVQVYAATPDFGWIAHSLVPEEMGSYGDFGRYVMGSAVHHFVDDERADGKASGPFTGSQLHDARFARRYVWQRVVELGWTPARYADFEKRLGYGGRFGDGKKVERLSKKYQWIGLHEYLGLLADSLLFAVWGGVDRPLRGAWELSVRDYDPSLAVGAQDVSADKEDGTPSWWKIENPISSTDTVEEKQEWVSSGFPTFEPYLTLNHESRQWIVLNTHLNFDEELGFGVEKYESARMSQWIDVRVFLVPKTSLAKTLKIFRSKDFFGDGCNIPESHQCWVSEYPWHAALAEIDESCRLNETWFRGLKKQFFLPVCEISKESKHVQLPAPTLHRGIGEALGAPLSAPKLTARGSVEIHSNDGRCILMGSTQGQRVLVVDQIAMFQYLVEKNYALVWAVLSEKSAWNGTAHAGGISRQSAVYVLADDGKISGGHTVTKTESPEKLMR